MFIRNRNSIIVQLLALDVPVYKQVVRFFTRVEAVRIGQDCTSFVRIELR